MRALGLLDSNGKPLADRIQRVLTGLLPETATPVSRPAGRRRTHGGHGGGGTPHRASRGARWADREAPRLRVGDGPKRRDVPHETRVDATDSENAGIRRPARPTRVVSGSRSGAPRRSSGTSCCGKCWRTLSPEERLVCVWKKAGFSSQEIAQFQGRSVAAVDTLFSRAKQKIRSALGVQDTGRDDRQSVRAVNSQAPEPQLGEEDTETPDGTTRSAPGR